MPWNSLLSFLFPLVLLLGAGSASCAGVGEGTWKPEEIILKGSIELDRLKAIETLEQKIGSFIQERYGEIWEREAGVLVPRTLLKKELRKRINRRWNHLPILGKRNIQVFETTAGKAFQGEYRVLVGGEEEKRFVGRTQSFASSIGDEIRIRLLAVAFLALLFFFLTGRVDRMTRGYLTKRLYLLSFLLVGFLFWGYAFQGMGGFV